MENKKHVVIVGGGFAGLQLMKGLDRSDKYNITLVDINNYNFFPPLLYQLAAGFMSLLLFLILLDDCSGSIKMRALEWGC